MDSFRTPRAARDVDVQEALTSDYDLVVVALGYEKRSSFIAANYSGHALQLLALGFPDRHIYSFAQNRTILGERGYRHIEVSDESFLDAWQAVLGSLTSRSVGLPIRVAIDISSFTRLRLALLLEGLVSCVSVHSYEVSFLYSVATFTPPGSDGEVATVCGPVTPHFAGWPGDPENPVAAVVGLGYEMDKAVGAFEYLEPTVRVLIAPISPDPAYDEAVEQANASLLLNDSAIEQYKYPVSNPTHCLELLDALTYRLQTSYRLVLLPFGPKIFSLCSMVIASRYYPFVGVWRVSPEGEKVRDQHASGHLVGLSVRFDPPA